MKKYALTGHPLGHSMSPFIHEKLFQASGKNEEYSLVDIAPENLEAELPKLLAETEGINVTIPHKSAVIPFTDKLDESAARYNSVNCINCRDGEIIGYNTDCDGFLRSVPREALSSKVLIIGCGGVGRMIAIEAARHGADITIAIIPEAAEIAKVLVDEITERYSEASVKTVMTDSIYGEFDLLINASPVGMYPKTDECPVTEEVIKNCKNVFDVIYNPSETKLMKTAASYGIPATGGMSMLVLQAVVAHEIWDGDSYTPEQINSIIKEATEIVDRDFK
ncbi:MAG: shikimate dehydrogenase [Oscillospiraceae bacterium]|nr:shikimate dehydrogenase [Oscillospiraceae bacterium]